MKPSAARRNTTRCGAAENPAAKLAPSGAQATPVGGPEPARRRTGPGSPPDSSTTATSPASVQRTATASGSRGPHDPAGVGREHRYRADRGAVVRPPDPQRPRAVDGGEPRAVGRPADPGGPERAAVAGQGAGRGQGVRAAEGEAAVVAADGHGRARRATRRAPPPRARPRGSGTRPRWRRSGCSRSAARAAPTARRARPPRRARRPGRPRARRGTRRPRWHRSGSRIPKGAGSATTTPTSRSRSLHRGRAGPGDSSRASRSACRAPSGPAGTVTGGWPTRPRIVSGRSSGSRRHRAAHQHRHGGAPRLQRRLDLDPHRVAHVHQAPPAGAVAAGGPVGADHDADGVAPPDRALDLVAQRGAEPHGRRADDDGAVAVPAAQRRRRRPLPRPPSRTAGG